MLSSDKKYIIHSSVFSLSILLFQPTKATKPSSDPIEIGLRQVDISILPICTIYQIFAREHRLIVYFSTKNQGFEYNKAIQDRKEKPCNSLVLLSHHDLYDLPDQRRNPELPCFTSD